MSSLRQESRFPWFEPRLIAVVVISSAAVWATSIVVGGWKATHGGVPEAPTPKTIEVSAEATAHATPDHMTWTITVHGRADDKSSALAKLRANLDSVHELLTTNGITDSELSFKSVSTDQQNSDVTNKDSEGNETTESVPGEYDSSQDIDVSLTDFKRGRAAQQALSLADDMEDVDVGEVTCTAKNIEEIEQQVLGQARANVRAHALQAVKEYGAHLGKLDTATIGSSDIGTDCSDITVTAEATASYELE